MCVCLCVYVCETFIRIPTMKKHHKEVCLTCLQETICDMQPNPGHKILIRHFLSASKRQEFVEMKKQVIGVRSSQETGAQSAISTILQKGVTVQYSENVKASNSTGTLTG